MGSSGAAPATADAGTRSKGSRNIRGSRLRSAVEFLTHIPFGTGLPSDGRLPLDLTELPTAINATSPSTAHASGAAKVPYESISQPLGGTDGLPSKDLAPQDVTSALETDSNANLLDAADGGTPGEIAVRLRGQPFRHITSRGHRSSKLFKEALLRDGVLDGRIAFARNKAYPTAVTSVIKYDAAVENAYHRDRQAAAASLLLAGSVANDSLPAWLRWKGRSYAGLLHAEHAPCCAERDSAGVGNGDGAGATGLDGQQFGSGGDLAGSGAGAEGSLHPPREPFYNPLGLDDPSIDLETQRFVVAREGYRVSILAYRNERSQKDGINERFARAHPWLDAGDGQALTLSKIRSLKRRVLHAWWVRGWEISTVALTAVYFERLVYRRLVNKGNRKLAFAACALLAWKMSEAREGAARPPAKASDVLDALETALGVQRKAVLKAEFPVFQHLRFGLAVPTGYAAPHLERLLLAKGATSLEYLGPALHGDYARAASDPSAHTLAPGQPPGTGGRGDDGLRGSDDDDDGHRHHHHSSRAGGGGGRDRSGSSSSGSSSSSSGSSRRSGRSHGHHGHSHHHKEHSKDREHHRASHHRDRDSSSHHKERERDSRDRDSS